jgi:hypothetical protein
MSMVCRTTTRCLLCLILCAACAGVQRAEAQLMRTLAAWVDNDRLSVSSSGYASSAHTVSLRMPLGGPHAVNVSGEYFRASSLPREYERRFRLQSDWKYRSIPITLSYSYSLPALTPRLHPVVGLGVSSHVFYERTRRVEKAGGETAIGFDKHYGVYLGAEATMGMRMVLSRHVFLLAQSRFRYVGDLSQMPAHSMYGPFTVLDFTFGVGFEL